MNPKIQGPQHDKHRYIKLTVDGASVICEPSEVTDMIEEGSEYTVAEVWMSPAEYDALPEFMGF